MINAVRVHCTQSLFFFLSFALLPTPHVEEYLIVHSSKSLNKEISFRRLRHYHISKPQTGISGQFYKGTTSGFRRMYLSPLLSVGNYVRNKATQQNHIYSLVRRAQDQGTHILTRPGHRTTDRRTEKKLHAHSKKIYRHYSIALRRLHPGIHTTSTIPRLVGQVRATIQRVVVIRVRLL